MTSEAIINKTTMESNSNTTLNNLKLEPLIEIDSALAGLDFMPDGRLVTVYGNKKCIVMNDKLVKIGKTYLLRTIPLDVVCMSDNVIAVTLDNKTVCVLVVDRDCVIREKRTFITDVQYDSLRKLDAGTLVGFTRDIPEHARKITMEGREEDFTTLTKRDYTSMCSGYKCTCLYIPSRNTFLTRDKKKKEQLQIHDTDMGSFKRVQFDENIDVFCQGPKDSVIVVCDNEVVQMTTDGVILRKCSHSGHSEIIVRIDKNFQKLATALRFEINLYSSTTTRTWCLEPIAELALAVTGMDFLPDGRLVVVYENKTCVIMNDKLNKIGKKFVLKSHPLDVCCMSDSDIAVPLDNMTICVLSVRYDGVIQEKCSFKTELQYNGVRKFDSTVMVGFAEECARKITVEGVEQEFKVFMKSGYPLPSYINCKYACIPCIQKLATFDVNTNVVYLQDLEKGISKCIQFEKEIFALCQGPAGTVLVVCDGEFVQMSCEGITLNKYSTDEFVTTVCANKDFSVIALSAFTSINLYKLSI